MWVFTQGPVTKISMETHKNHLVLSGRCICVSYCCRSLRVFTCLCHLVEKPQVFVITFVMIPRQQRPLRTNNCAEAHCSKFPRRALVYIHWKPFWTGPAQDINGDYIISHTVVFRGYLCFRKALPLMDHRDRSCYRYSCSLLGQGYIEYTEREREHASTHPS